MRPQIVTVGSQTSSAAIPVDWRQVPCNLGIGCVLSGGGSLTFKVQYTYDNVLDPLITATWFDHATITGKTASFDGSILFPVAAVRLTVTAYTSGNVTMTVLQGAQK